MDTGKSGSEGLRVRSGAVLARSLIDSHAMDETQAGERVRSSRRGRTAHASEHAPSKQGRIDGVSDSEIAQLVIIALERALGVLGDMDPETSLRLTACEARRGMRALFASIPRERRGLGVQRDYHEAVVFQNLSLNLSLSIVAAVRGYAKARESVG